MEMTSLEIDFDNNILKINGKEITDVPVIVTLPGLTENLPYRKLFNSNLATGKQEECDRLEVFYKPVLEPSRRYSLNAEIGDCKEKKKCGQ